MLRGGPRYGSQWAQRRLRRSLALGWMVALLACDADSSARIHPDAAPEPHSDRRPALCQREVESSDPVRKVFCSETPADISSLHELMLQLTKASLSGDLNTLVASPALLGHSTSLSGHHVSSINPRAILMLAPSVGPVITFTRGVQQVEMAALSHDRNTRRFYLLKFKQACNARPEGCRSADLYTLQAEQDWQALELFDDEELKNTALDCRQCHQRARSTPQLLMRELVRPWTHFFEPVSQEEGLRSVPGVLNSALTRDYIAAKGDELYAGIDVDLLAPRSGSRVQGTVGAEQPVLFSSQEILNERWPRMPDGNYPAEPVPSTLWENAYAAFKRGEQLALPYVEQRATDPAKLADRTAAYAAYRAGTLDAADLPDFADVFPDDPLLRARIGLQTEPDAEPVDTLIQACGPCHNDVLDQSLTRAHFNIDLARMDGPEIELAIDRMLRQPGEVGVMPPPEARQLDPSGRERLIEFLRTDARSGEADPALRHAAQVGMTGGGRFSSGGATGL